MGSKSDESIRSRKGWQVGDAAFYKLLWTLVVIVIIIIIITIIIIIMTTVMMTKMMIMSGMTTTDRKWKCLQDTRRCSVESPLRCAGKGTPFLADSLC